MRTALTAVAVLAVVLASSACGSGRRSGTVFPKVSTVGGVAVPTPAGFRSRTWRNGVVISNRSGKILIPCTSLDGCGSGIAAGKPSEDELVVYRTVFMEVPPKLTLPLSLPSLHQMSDGLHEWDGAGSIDHAGDYGVAVWLGPSAPTADRAAILDALQAIKPR